MTPCASAWPPTSQAYDRVVDLRAVGFPDVLAPGLLAPGGAPQRRLVAGAAGRTGRGLRARGDAAGVRGLGPARRARAAGGRLGVGRLVLLLAALLGDL